MWNQYILAKNQLGNVGFDIYEHLCGHAQLV